MALIGNARPRRSGGADGGQGALAAAGIALIGILSVAAPAGCKGEDTAKPPANPPSNPPPATEVTMPEYWKLTIQLPGAPLEVGVTLESAGGKLVGKADIPAQNAIGVPVTGIARDGSSIALTLPPGAAIEAQIDAGGVNAKGTMKQAGQTYPVAFEKVAKAADLPQLPKRPQTPRPPFPYEQRDVSYENPDDGTRIAGTLTVPKSEGPHPVALLITGSGAQDRDETLFGHKPFLVLADHLTRKGIAVLRVDDRGVGKTTGDPRTSTMQLEAADVKAGIEFLKKQKGIDPARIGLIGHSSGGMVAPMVAAGSKDVAFIVTLAGAGVSGAELIPAQLGVILEKSGIAPDGVAQIVEQQRKVTAAVAEGMDEKQLVALIAGAITLTRKVAPQLDPSDKTPSEIEEDARAELAKFGTWFRSFLRLDPATHWPRVSCPVLAINGENDTQVPAEENLSAISAALGKGGNKRISTQTIPKLNHLFQTSSTGLPDEYAAIEETFHPPTLEVISTWITDTTKPAP